MPPSKDKSSTPYCLGGWVIVMIIEETVGDQESVYFLALVVSDNDVITTIELHEVR